MTAVSVVPSLDYEAVVSSLLLLVGAIAAIVAGAWKGWQNVKKTLRDPSAVSSQTDEKVKIVSATIVETTTLARLTESNNEVRGAVCELHRTLEDHTNEMKQSRYATQQASESMQRLLSAIEHNSRIIERTGLKI